jgi:hypothetical protein
LPHSSSRDALSCTSYGKGSIYMCTHVVCGVVHTLCCRSTCPCTCDAHDPTTEFVEQRPQHAPLVSTEPSAQPAGQTSSFESEIGGVITGMEALAHMASILHRMGAERVERVTRTKA